MVVVAGLGAAVGALGRYGLTRLVQSLYGNQWPLATLLINWLGCLILGLITGWHWDQTTMVLVGTGVLGGFTTYSTFSHELVMLAYQRRYLAMLGYLSASVIGGLLLAFGGFSLGMVIR
ncbi:fluoride efflux transporter FluC [Levilactobacillus brevis]|uniref:fluoride efflux transporter FluC n=1 Tax=Levilactobacillus brevis TaxID=1580 RepID=UPI00111899AE|nr:CrcB family protein [Levilactobacillus brevis]QCZ42740.1 camphor resistance protein CrcB [Levilactobacillus brevis]